MFTYISNIITTNTKDTLDDLSICFQCVKRKFSYDWLSYIFILTTTLWYSLYLRIFAYWLTLGIISSIGFGTGVHTGILYLFPHVINNREYGWNNIFIGIIWGSGSSLGEIPPFLVAREYRKLAQHTPTSTEVNIQHSPHGTTAVTLPIELSKPTGISEKYVRYVVDFVRKYGFWTILISASYPNMFFDVLGLICGYYGFSLWEFFFPTFIGKALIKAPLQVIVVNHMAYYYEDYLDQLPISENSRLFAFANMFIGFYMLKQLITGFANKERSTRTA